VWITQRPGPQLLALLQDVGPARAVDGAVDPAAAEQPGVRRVHHGVDLLFGDVALRQLDARHRVPFSPVLS
jgi:hypothetical protein